MSVSTAVVGDNSYNVVGNRKVTVTDVTFDSSYPTGGEPVTPSDLRLNYVDHATCNIVGVGGTVNVTNAYYDKTNQKIVAVDETPAEVASTSDLSTLVVRVRAQGF